MSNLYIDKSGQLHTDQWFIIEGVAGIEVEDIPVNIYFLTYCI